MFIARLLVFFFSFFSLVAILNSMTKFKSYTDMCCCSLPNIQVLGIHRNHVSGNIHQVNFLTACWIWTILFLEDAIISWHAQELDQHWKTSSNLHNFLEIQYRILISLTRYSHVITMFGCKQTLSYSFHVGFIKHHVIRNLYQNPPTVV